MNVKFRWKSLPLLALACGVAFGTIASADSTAATPATSTDAITAALMKQALSQPEVAETVRQLNEQVGGAGSSGAATPPTPMIEVGNADTAHAPKASDSDDPRSSRHFGVDARVGAPLGAGVGFHYTIVAPISIGAAVDTTGVAYSVTAEATVYILPIFMHAKWTPAVNVAFSHIQFTGLANSAIAKFAPNLAANGVNLDASGIWMNTISVMAGVDYVGSSGFHFSVMAGHIFQVGDSGGGTSSDTKNGVVLSGWHSWAATVSVGYDF